MTEERPKAAPSIDLEPTRCQIGAAEIRQRIRLLTPMRVLPLSGWVAEAGSEGRAMMGVGKW